MPGFFLCVWMWLRDARGRWHRSVAVVGDAFEVLGEGWRGTPEEGGIAPGRDSVVGYY